MKRIQILLLALVVAVPFLGCDKTVDDLDERTKPEEQSLAPQEKDQKKLQTETQTEKSAEEEKENDSPRSDPSESPNGPPSDLPAGADPDPSDQPAATDEKETAEQQSTSEGIVTSEEVTTSDDATTSSDEVSTTSVIPTDGDVTSGDETATSSTAPVQGPPPPSATGPGKEAAVSLSCPDGRYCNFMGPVALAVSGDGSTVVVGDQGESTGGSSAGAVFVYSRGPKGEWGSEPAVLKAPNPEKNDRFGADVALSGDGNMLAVGAWGDDDGGQQAGAVFVFTRADGKWSGPVRLENARGDRFDLFGSAVAISRDGKLLAVSSQPVSQDQQKPFTDDHGAIHLFTRDDKGKWIQNPAPLTSSQPASHRDFGSRIVLSGDASTLATVAVDLQNNEFLLQIIPLDRGGAKGRTAVIPVGYQGEPGFFQGTFLSVSDGGALVALGVERGGKIRMFGRSGDTWGLKSTVEKGPFVALSGNGMTWATAAGTGEPIRLYRPADPAQPGSPSLEIPPVGNGESNFGRRMALSDDGGTLVVQDTKTGEIHIFPPAKPAPAPGTKPPVQTTTSTTPAGGDKTPAKTTTPSGTTQTSTSSTTTPGTKTPVKTTPSTTTTTPTGGDKTPAKTTTPSGTTQTSTSSTTAPGTKPPAKTPSTKTSPLAPPPAPTLDVKASVKKLHFTWNAVEGAASYRLYRQENGETKFKEFTRTTASIPVAFHLIDVAKTSYWVEACNSKGCSPSVRIAAKDLLPKTVGRFDNPHGDVSSLTPFGSSVALSGDGSTLAVGDPSYKESPERTLGAFYVNSRGEAGLSAPVLVKAPNADPNDQFGFSVALSADGNTLAVGAPSEDSVESGVLKGQTKADSGKENNCGAAYVFTRLNNGWGDPVYFKSSSAHKFWQNFFGGSVALSADGNTLVVGARTQIDPRHDPANVAKEQIEKEKGSFASFEVFRRSGGDWGTKGERFISPDQEMTSQFARSLALSGDGRTISVVADIRDAEAGITVWTYSLEGVDWRTDAEPLEIVGKSDAPTRGSVISLSHDGTRMAVSESDIGPIRLYERSGAAWVERESLGSGGYAALSGDGKTLVVGNDSGQGGSFSVFAESKGAWIERAKNVGIPGVTPDDYFARVLALSRDGQTLAVGSHYGYSIFLY